MTHTPFAVKDVFAYQIAQLDRLIELEKQNADMLTTLKYVEKYLDHVSSIEDDQDYRKHTSVKVKRAIADAEPK